MGPFVSKSIASEWLWSLRDAPRPNLLTASCWQAYCSVQSSARNLANCIKPGQTCRAINIGFNSTALIMRSGYYWNRLLRYVDPEPQTCLINVRETFPNKFRGSVRDIQKNTFRA